MTHRKYKLLSAHLMISYCDIWGVLQQQFHHGKVMLMYSTVKTSLALQHITESGRHATRQTDTLHTVGNLMDACRALIFGMTDDQGGVTGACACSSCHTLKCDCKLSSCTYLIVPGIDVCTSLQKTLADSKALLTGCCVQWGRPLDNNGTSGPCCSPSLGR